VAASSDAAGTPTPGFVEMEVNVGVDALDCVPPPPGVDDVDSVEVVSVLVFSVEPVPEPHSVEIGPSASCSDADGKPVTIAIEGGPSHGSLGTVGSGGQVTYTPATGYSGTDSFTFTAESGAERSLSLKLTRRLSLEPPKVSGDTVTLVGQVVPPLAKPAGAIEVEQQLECGRATIVKRAEPSASGHFRITLTVPDQAQAGIYRLASTVRKSARSKKGFATYSLPLPAVLG
jgi:Bacterial Ig domain